MFIATAIVSAVFALALILSAAAKLGKNPAIIQTMETVGFPVDRLWLLALAEIAGGVGLVAGLFWAPLGIAAAIGTTLYFLGATGSHLRVGDRNIGGAVVMLIVAIAALILQILNA